MNRRELVLGTKTRSGQQWDIWEAVYSPVGPDGYPKRIFDKRTGAIDRAVAEYWKERYDLSHILQRDWNKGLGAKLAGKIHIYVGDMDNYYLNNAVYLIEDVLKAASNPPYGGEIDYGDRAEHCWNGDHIAAQCRVSAPLPPDVRAEDRGEDPEERAARRGSHELALLITIRLYTNWSRAHGSRARLSQ